jgi:predicted nucleic-acid-binding Zn-ribbon protein
MNTKDIIAAIREKGADNPCVRCNSMNMRLMTVVNNMEVEDGKRLPFITIICENCGYIYHHAIAICTEKPKAE